MTSQCFRKSKLKCMGHPIWKLYIDDLRTPLDDTYVIARTLKDAQELVLTYGVPMFISFDHDLGMGDDGEILPSGYDFTKWLVEMDMEGTIIIPRGFDFKVHSQNPVGAQNIRQYLRNYLDFKEKNENLCGRKIPHFHSLKDLIGETMSFGIQMREDAVSLLSHTNGNSDFAHGTVMLFGFSKDAKDVIFPKEFERACEQYCIDYERFSFEPATFWLFGQVYTIALETMADFEKAIPMIEAFGGSTERFLLKSADVRLTTKSDILIEHEAKVELEKSIKAHFDIMGAVK